MIVIKGNSSEESECFYTSLINKSMEIAMDKRCELNDVEWRRDVNIEEGVLK